MIYREYKPSSKLSAYVECYWSAYAEQPPFQEREALIPDGTIELMFNFGDNYAQVIDNKKETVKGSHIIGIRKKALVISQTSRQNFFCIRFRLGGFYPFFELPTHKFAHGFYQLEDLLDHTMDTLEHKLFEADTDQARVELTNEFLLKNLQLNLADYQFVQACSQKLLSDQSASVETLTEQFNASYKTIERKFRRVIGLTPSRLLSIKRFNRAIHTMYTCKYRSLAEVAYHSGYYDQSHFIRQFKKLARHTPRQFLKQQFTIVKVIQPALAKRLSKSYNLS